MCVEERWYLHWLVLVINCGTYCLTQIFDLSVGYRQIKSVPTMLVMLSYSWLIPRAYTITSLVWPILSLVHIILEFHLCGNLDELLLSPSATLLPSPWFVLNIQLVLETSKSIIFMSRSWSICWMKEVTFSDSRAFGASCRREFEKDCFFSLVPSQVSHACAKYAMVWQARNLHSICIPSTPSH